MKAAPSEECCCPLKWGGTSKDPIPDDKRPDPECPLHGKDECK